MLVLAAAGDPGPGQAGLLALIIIVVLVVVCFFLFRSMARQLRKVPASFDRADDAVEGAAEDRSDEPGNVGGGQQPH